MSIVSLLGIKVLNNPAKFTDPYEFEITFECLEQLKDDLEWKLTYVGSSRSLEHDQELDSLLVGPVPVGINKFILTADAPSPELIPASELVSVTVILLSCSYKEREFVRVGYYVNNEYDSEELRENPPAKVQVDHIVRNILAEKPRVTRFNIAWDNEGGIDDYPPEQEGEEELDGDDIIDMGADEELEDVEAEDEEEEDEDEDDAEEPTTKLDTNAETAKRQNTLNDDDIPEIKKRKIEETEAEAEDKEEDLDELEEEDEEELEEELEEDEEDGEEVEEVEGEVEGEVEAEESEAQDAGISEAANVENPEEMPIHTENDPVAAETPKIDSVESTPQR